MDSGVWKAVALGLTGLGGRTKGRGRRDCGGRYDGRGGSVLRTKDVEVARLKESI
jgi:hypothetical protein